MEKKQKEEAEAEENKRRAEEMFQRVLNKSNNFF